MAATADNGGHTTAQMADTSGARRSQPVRANVRFTATRPYLPYTAATSLAGDALGGGAFGPVHDTSGGTPLPFAATVALLAAMAITLALVSARTSVRRDVT